MTKTRSSTSSVSRRGTLVLAALLLVLAATVAHAVHVSDWYAHRVVQRVSNSIVHLTSADGAGICSGFVVAPNRIVTARHCADDTVAADGKPTTLVHRDEFYDLALFSVETARPALRIASERPHPGDRVALIGYAWGQFLVWHFGELEYVNAKVQDDFAKCMLTDRDGVGGMSGGPVVNLEGDVVSVVSRGNSGFSCGVSPLLIRAFLEQAL
jgi:S1-C subfamily serine protease